MAAVKVHFPVLPYMVSTRLHKATQGDATEGVTPVKEVVRICVPHLMISHGGSLRPV